MPGGYQVEVADVNGDRKPDVVALGGGTCAWYENPSWRKRIVTNSKQTPGIISSATADLDGITAQQWDTTSLCSEWTVRDVLAHMTATARLSGASFFPSFQIVSGPSKRGSMTRRRSCVPTR